MKIAVVLGGLLLIGALAAGGYMVVNYGELPAVFGVSKTRQPPPRLTDETTADTTVAQQDQGAEANTADAGNQSDVPADTTTDIDAASDNPEQSTDDGPVRFVLPVDCTVGRTCVVQNYVDMQGGQEFGDYTCGSLSYDEHHGTDIRLPSHKEMEAGVAVLAAAGGVVERVRDGMPDVNFRLVGREAVTDRGLGNTVIIRHADGLVTGYGHMKRGSISVAEGDTVSAGQKIGMIGLSGLSEFPHLHFEVRQNNIVVDPFTGAGAETGCGVPVQPLWADATLQQLQYIPSLVMRIGFSDRELNRAAIEYGLHQTGAPLDRNAETLLLHVYVAGLRTGDIARFELTDPLGDTFIDAERIIDQKAAVQLLRAGAADRTTPWDAGTYTGVFTLTRMTNGEPDVVLRAETSADIE
ncbi:MAG: M23 family metallopeptidase [Alphaproteobacteria bacterium]